MRFFKTYRSPLAVVSVIILLAGVFMYDKMQSSLFPEITFPKIKIICDAGQMPVDKMMVSVTRPIEQAVKQVPSLKLLRSTTSRGSCELSAFMDWSVDIDKSQQQIESKINAIKNLLPADVEITVEKMNPSILPVIGYTLESNSFSPVELKMLALYNIKPFLSQVDGVSEVRVIGGKQKEYQLQLNAEKMTALGVTPDKVSLSLSETGFIRSNGYQNDYRRMYLSITDAQLRNKVDLENLVVSNDGKRIVRLSDISTIEIKEAKEYIKINANGKEAILLAVVKQPNANLLQLSADMNAKVEELKKALPKNVIIKPYYEQADFVNDSIKSVRDSLLIGLLLAIVVAILFLRSFKASTTILVGIPLTLCLTVIVLYAMGMTFNIMTLGAIAAAIGLIIDDAIVVVEQIHRTKEENPNEKYSTIVGKALSYLFPAMIGSSLSTIVIFIPFLLMSGVAGAYFKVMTNTMIVTLVCSFFVTWLLLPVVYLFLSSDSRRKKEDDSHEVKTRPWIKFFITKPYISFLIILLFAGSIVFILPRLTTGFLPEMDEGSIVMDYSSPPGTSLEETDHMLSEANKIILQIPEVDAYSCRIGTQMGFFITEPNTGDYLIQLKKNRTRTTEQVIEDIRARIEAREPALRIDFGQVIGDMLGDLMASVQPVEVKIFGSDRKVLHQLARQIAAKVEKVDGAADVFDGIVIAGPSVSVQPRSAQLAQLGITPANLQTQIQNSVEGTLVGNIFESDQLTNVRMVYSNFGKNSIEQLNNLNLFLPDGKLQPVKNLVDIKIDSGDAEIERENLQNMCAVTARLESRDLGSVMNDVKKIVSTISLPTGYHIEYGGAYAEQQKSFDELLMILITACLLVFGVILFLFRDFKIACTILLISVLGIAGSYVALFITNTPLNVGSYTGIIMIVGIIGENAIFTFLQFRESMNGGQKPDDAIIYSISTRLRPKLMTAFGAIIALMPIALGIGTGAQLHQPLAIAVIGGFLSALPLLLIVFPSLLNIIYRNQKIKTNS